MAVAVVTGGTAGVGRATARELMTRGFDVAVLARGRAGLEGTVDELTAMGGRALGIACDVADFAAVQAAADQVERELGPIEAWINNAFVGVQAYAWDVTEEEFRRVTDVGYLGQVNGTLAALARMRPRDRGHVVNVSSSLAHRGIPLQAAYCGAKHAVKGFTESVSTELVATKSAVTVGLVTLPAVNTPQFDDDDDRLPGNPTPVPPIYQPEVCARAIVLSVLRPRRDLWVGTPTVYTIWGQRLLPGVMDWYLARNGVRLQLTDEAPATGDKDLDAPRDEVADSGAHGPFDDRSRSRDPVSAVLGRMPSSMSRSGNAVGRSLFSAVGAVVERGFNLMRRAV